MYSVESTYVLCGEYKACRAGVKRCTLLGEYNLGGDMSKVVRIERVTQVDHETGEVTRESMVQSTGFMSDPPYIKMYSDSLGITQIPDTLLLQFLNTLTPLEPFF